MRGVWPRRRPSSYADWVLGATTPIANAVALAPNAAQAPQASTRFAAAPITHKNAPKTASPATSASEPRRLLFEIPLAIAATPAVGTSQSARNENARNENASPIGDDEGVSRGTHVVTLAAALGACGRIGFSNLSTDAGSGDATSSDAAFTPVLLGSDDFGRTLASGWGNADLGGVWYVFNPQNNALSVGSGHGNVAMAATIAYPDFHVVTATALDAQTRAIVSFDRVPTTGSYAAMVSVRWVASGTDYRLHVDVLPGGSIDVFIERGNGTGETTLANGTSAITVTPGTGVELSLVATGVSPTTLCGKLWLEGSAEPSACTVSVQDSTAALQVPGLSYLTTNVSGSAAPTLSFSTFRYLRIGPQ
jgi:hypothetical protein